MGPGGTKGAITATCPLRLPHREPAPPVMAGCASESLIDLADGKRARGTYPTGVKSSDRATRLQLMLLKAQEHTADAGSIPAASTIRGRKGFDVVMQAGWRHSAGVHRDGANHKGQSARVCPAYRRLTSGLEAAPSGSAATESRFSTPAGLNSARSGTE